MGAIVALGVGFLFITNKETAPEKPPTPSPAPPPLSEARFETLKKNTRHFKGDPNARITVIEFADFQCPSCRMAYEAGVKLLGSEIKEVYFGFRHWPIESMHPFAKPAALGTEACARQGKFWDAYHNLFKGPMEELTQELIDASIKASGVDKAKYDLDLKDSALSAAISNDKEEGTAAGVTQTPTFIVHDKQTHKVTLITGYKNLVTELKDTVKLPMPPDPAGNSAMVRPPQ